jgi:[NiFe] hydrogenase assembly HybE family chaperone
MSFDAAPASQLEALFRRIHTTDMAGMPVLNDALAVEAIGFRRCAYGWLGILITPWFMNLMLLPAAGTPWISLAAGKQCDLSFPSGDYRFSADSAPELGEYLSCQLFSPMYHFHDQATARTAAGAALAAVMAAPAAAVAEEGETVSLSKRRLLRGIFSPTGEH